MYPSIEKLRAIGFDQHAFQAFHISQQLAHTSHIQRGVVMDQQALQAFHLIESEQSPKQPALQLARISNIQRDHVMLHDGASEKPARLRPALHQDLQASGETLAVGDWVLFRQQGEAWVEIILPARNRLCRRNPEGQRQSLVANIDIALLVMGLDHDFNLSTISCCSGVFWAMVIIQGSALAPQLEIAGHLLTGVVAFLMCIQAKQRWLGFIPGTFIGACATFAGGGNWQLMSTSLLIGLAFGYAMKNSGLWLAGLNHRSSKD